MYRNILYILLIITRIGRNYASINNIFKMAKQAIKKGRFYMILEAVMVFTVVLHTEKQWLFVHVD